MGKNVLIVEDEGIVSLELQEQIEGLGHTVVGVADTGEEAIELARTKRPDLILMDIRLKGAMDGAEAAAMIRKTSDVPVVFLTAYSGDEILQRAMQSEPYAYLIKPIQEQQLYGALRVVWNKHHHDSIRKQNAKRFSSIVSALPHGIVLTDTALKVRYLNTRAKQLLGVASTREVWGKGFCEIVAVEEPTFEESLRSAMYRVLDDRQAAHLGEHPLRVGDTARPYSFDVSAFADSGTRLYGVLVIISDPHSAPSAAPAAEAFGASALWGGMDAEDITLGVERLGELRSYLELEIIRLSLGEPPLDTHTRGFRAGQIQGNKRVLQLVFGSEALHDVEQIIGG